MTTRETEQTAVGRLAARVAELSARVLKWQAFAVRKAIDLRETRISLGCLLAREAELVGAAAADSGARESQTGPRSTAAHGWASLAECFARRSGEARRWQDVADKQDDQLSKAYYRGLADALDDVVSDIEHTMEAKPND